VGAAALFWQARRTSRRFWLPFTMCVTALIVSITIDVDTARDEPRLCTRPPAIPDRLTGPQRAIS